MTISLADVQAAAGRIRSHVRRTPIIEIDLDALTSTPGRAWLKLEQLQYTGSFKPRGAFNRILKAMEEGRLPPAGVIVASGGNAGLGVAYAAAQLGIPARVVLPTSAPRVKVEKLRKLDAEVVQAGQIYEDAYHVAVKEASDTGALFCHAYDQPEICAGQGTLALELLEQTEELDTIIVAVGGGGLLAGVTTAVAGQARVVAVEPEAAPTLNTALATGRPVDVSVTGVASDSLGATRIGDIGYAVAAQADVQSVLVSEDAIREARRMLWDGWRIAVEYGAATAFAGLVSGSYRPGANERLALVLCGANTDPADLAT
ncbi:threonine dehydratase [Nonomuraea solani]|uniref:threonine ammonia-lyase n=1 Tax=Nonomuraea solani TaxID=1144553 RepID=A0A1H5SZH4_9ACTN|nr:threonine/serine dehydratase [Nonomuraea solani]SEF55874.1 threonine dehydratase [Nonomuraea solani]